MLNLLNLALIWNRAAKIVPTAEKEEHFNAMQKKPCKCTDVEKQQHINALLKKKAIKMQCWKIKPFKCKAEKENHIITKLKKRTIQM